MRACDRATRRDPRQAKWRAAAPPGTPRRAAHSRVSAIIRESIAIKSIYQLPIRVYVREGGRCAKRRAHPIPDFLD